MGLRVVLGEDNLLVREGITHLLAGDDEIDLVGVATDMPSVLAACERLKPDVVITDIRMPPSHTDEGIRLANELLERDPAIGVVVLSQHSDPVYVLALLEHGSERRAYLLKERLHNRGRADRRDQGGRDGRFDDRCQDRGTARPRCARRRRVRRSPS